MKIWLFTFSYPFGIGEQFLHEEVIFFSQQEGLELIIVPFKTDTPSRVIPENVKVDTTLAKEVERRSENKIYPVLQNLTKVISGILHHRIRNWTGLIDVVGFAHHGEIVRNWANKKLGESDLLYTYWFDRVTYGLSQYMNEKSTTNQLITRAHGYDVYDSRRKHNFIPYRSSTLQSITGAFSVSKDGENHMITNYGFDDKIGTAYLGIGDHGGMLTKQDEVVRVVSCSAIIELKRVDLIAQSIRTFSANNEGRIVEWHHFGDGDRTILHKVLTSEEQNLKVVMHGNIPNEDLIKFYQQTYVDLFMNLSSSEGIPVSIMEAISFGIPIVAVDVGGVSEIVNETNGVLLSNQFAIKDVENVIVKVLAKDELRAGARKIFEDNFIGQKNYHSFYKELLSLANEK